MNFNGNHKSVNDSDSLSNSFDSQKTDTNCNTSPSQQPHLNGNAPLLPQHALPLNMMHNGSASQFYQYPLPHPPMMHPHMRGPLPSNPYMYPFNMMPPPHFFPNLNIKQGLTDREEMDMKPSVDVLNHKKPLISQATPVSTLNIQVKKLNISSTLPASASTSTIASTPATNSTNGVLTPTNEILPLNKPIIPLEKIIQVDKKHNKQKSQLTSKEELHKKIDSLLQNYLDNKDAAHAVKTLKNYKFNHE